MSKNCIGTVLYQGPSFNALGDHRHQLLLEITPEMGLSVLGPCHQCDKLVGDENSHVPANRFAEMDGSPFKVAAIKFLTEEEQCGHEPHNGLFYRTVGYLSAGDTYERNWAFWEINNFADTIRHHGLAGIQPDNHFDSEWAAQQAKADIRRRLADGSLIFEVGENIPPGFGDPSINKPVDFILCWAFIRAWRGIAPPGHTLKKFRVSRPIPEKGCIVQLTTEKDGVTYQAEDTIIRKEEQFSPI